MKKKIRCLVLLTWQHVGLVWWSLDLIGKFGVDAVEYDEKIEQVKDLKVMK